jgi:outer membrane protein assembly factor BamB
MDQSQVFVLNKIARWSAKLPEVTHAQLPSSDDRDNPTLDSSRVYASIFAAGAVCAVERETGRLAWRHALSGLGGSSLLQTNSHLLAKTARQLIALDPQSGAVCWEFEPYKQKGEWLYSSPTSYGGLLYIGDRQGFLHCLDANTGKCVWSSLTNQDHKDCNATPIVHGHSVLTATNAGQLLAYDCNSGRQLWQQTLDGPCAGPLLKTQKHVIVRTQSVGFYDLDTGALAATYSIPGQSLHSLTQHGQLTAALFSDVSATFSKDPPSTGLNELVVLNEGLLIHRSQVTGWVATLGGHPQHSFITLADCEKLRFLDPETAEVLAEINGGDEKSADLGHPQVTKRDAFILSGNGNLYALDLAEIGLSQTAN